jgi:hypothetical protein
MCRGEPAVGEGNALALLERVIGELARRRTAGNGGGGETLGCGGDGARTDCCVGERRGGRRRARGMAKGRRKARVRGWWPEVARGGALVADSGAG